MRFRKERHVHGIEFSMTSMVDVISNVVIYFLIVQQFSQLEVSDVSLPSADQAQEVAPLPTRVVVNVQADERLIVAGETMSLDLVAGLLRSERDRLQAAGRQGDLSVLIRADGGVPYARVQDLLAQCARLDIWHVTFAAAPDEKEGP